MDGLFDALLSSLNFFRYFSDENIRFFSIALDNFIIMEKQAQYAYKRYAYKKKKTSTGGLRLDCQVGQIKHSVANVSPPQR